MSSSTASGPDHAGHRQRLRKRFLRAPHEAEEYEVLELLLGYGLIRKDTKPLAKELLRRFGSLRGVLDARPDELEQVPDFGPGLSAFWQILRECMSRHAETAVRQREVLATPEAVAAMARVRLTGCPHEECWVALVDRQNRCLSWERLLRGALDNVPVTPRDVLELALQRKACGVIVVHNHPGGKAQASASDLALTQELARLAPGMGVRFVDHVIVTEEHCLSLMRQEFI